LQEHPNDPKTEVFDAQNFVLRWVAVQIEKCEGLR
jgi:hypothetical protein